MGSATAEVVAHEQMNLRAIHYVLDRLRHEAGKPLPLSVPVTTDARATVQVRPHLLSTYDQLHQRANPNDDAKGGEDDAR